MPEREPPPPGGAPRADSRALRGTTPRSPTLSEHLPPRSLVDAFEERGLDFLMTAFNRATYLEDLTGLTQMHAETEAALEDCVGFSDDEEDF